VQDCRVIEAYLFGQLPGGTLAAWHEIWKRIFSLNEALIEKFSTKLGDRFIIFQAVFFDLFAD